MAGLIVCCHFQSSQNRVFVSETFGSQSVFVHALLALPTGRKFLFTSTFRYSHFFVKLYPYLKKEENTWKLPKKYSSYSAEKTF